MFLFNFTKFSKGKKVMLLMLFIMYEISDGNYFLTESHFYKTICLIIFSHLSSAKNECLLLTSCQRNMLRGHSTTTWTRRGGGGSAKSPRLSTQGGRGSLECPRGPKPSYFRKYFILLCTVMGGKKEINYI